ncbi:MAG TPA: magnesium and cobalt transport protein CorA [Verrucomicrobia bacterium]|nr:MAG: magnesium and cobalt transport protein CorA [Lentisphaerae bacterium GWF2_57_35]HBA83734.1 magnesium and cobalt transport protein CorA [Verrucomicrobiota bacterium]
MIRSFIFSQGKLLNQDVGLDVLRVLLYDEDVQIWVDAEKPTPEEIKALLQDVFNFHPLAIEDCVAVSERPKIDDYETYVFMVIHAVDYLHSSHEFSTTELNMFIGKNFFVTYHEEPLRSTNTIIERVQRNAPTIARAPDRLTYHILDVLLDNYQPALNELSGELANLEKKVLTSEDTTDIMNDVVKLKNEVSHLRQIITPQREVIARIARGEFFKVFRAHLLPYFRDLLDQLVRISTLADNYRDSLTNIMQMHLNLQQMQVNRVIKVLTVLATLTMPILAVTSFYGMNIQHMPNTAWPTWPYAYAWIISLTLGWTALLFWYIRRKGWY